MAGRRVDLRPVIKLRSTAGTGHTYVTTKNRRNTVTARRLPVIIVSACAFARDATEATDAGADLFLTKPCLPEELVAAIRRVVRPARARRMLRAAPGHRHRRQV